MTPDERQMIADLFERLRSSGVDKDREADTFISQQLRNTQDAGYKLVQSVIINEGQLQESSYRIEELEGQVQQLEDQLAQAQGQRRPAAGGFLGAGAGRQQQAPVSTPVTGRSGSFGGAPQQGGSPWGSQQPQQGGYAQPQQQQPMQAQAAPAKSGGGFFKGALLGAAAGALGAGALGGMFGGGSSSANAAGSRDATPSEGATGYAGQDQMGGQQADNTDYNDSSSSEQAAADNTDYNDSSDSSSSWGSGETDV